MTIQIKPGDRIVMRNQKSHLRMEALVRHYSDGSVFDVRLDGTSAANTFHKKDWIIEVLPPEIEDGLYVAGMSIYRVQGETIKYVGANFDEIRPSVSTRAGFAHDVAGGHAVRVADLQGNPVPALKNKE